jgi:hypothetical protein
MRAPAGQDRDGVVRDHRLHVGDVVEGFLTGDEPKRPCDRPDTQQSDGDICFWDSCTSAA